LELTAVAEAQSRRNELAAKQGRGELSPAEREQLEDDEARLREFRPQWLAWASATQSQADVEDSLPTDEAEQARRLETLALLRQPKVLARFEGEAASFSARFPSGTFPPASD
jgi:hypothetical protein